MSVDMQSHNGHSVCLLIPGCPVNQSKSLLPLTTAPDLVRMQEANRMRVCTVDLRPPCLDLCISMLVVLNMGHMCHVLLCVCVVGQGGECVYGEFPRECDITQHGLLLGVLLLLPATPLPESMILHTHTLAPTEVTPTGPNFPLHLQPASRLCVYIYARVCVCVCAYCLPACQPIKSMLQNICLPGPLPVPTSQPIKMLNL